MSHARKQAELRKLVQAREVKARKQEVLRKKKSAEERGKRYDEHNDHEYGPDEVVPTLFEDEPLRYGKRKAEDENDEEAEDGQRSAKKAKTDKMPIYRDRKSKPKKLSEATKKHLDALRNRTPGSGPYPGTMATTQNALTVKDPNTHQKLIPIKKGNTQTPSRLPRTKLSNNVQKELERKIVGPVDGSVANAQRAMSDDASGLKGKRKLEAEDESLTDSVTAPSAKKMKLDDEYGHSRVEYPKKTQIPTKTPQVETKPAEQVNLNPADKRPWGLGGTGNECPHIGKNTKITQEIIIDKGPARNEGTQKLTPSIPPNRSPSNGQTQGQVPKPQGKESTLPPPAPVGIRNFHFACYANTTIHALASSPGFVNHYRALAAAHDITPEVAAFVAAHANDLESPGNATRSTLNKRTALRKLLEKHKEEICLGAYLGDLLQKLRSGRETGKVPSSFLFLQACAAVFEHVTDEPFNGEGPEECRAFLEKLLERLEVEELMARTRDQEKPSLVRSLFGVESQQIIRCSHCRISRDSAVENAFSLQVEIPKGKKTTCITICLERYSDPVAVEWRCTTCGKTDTTTKSLHLTKLAPYTFINLVRCVQDEYGNHMKDMARVTLPVSSRMELDTKEGSMVFQLIADMTHHGATIETGHWTALCIVNDQWWLFDDAKTHKLGNTYRPFQHHDSTLGLALFKKRPQTTRV